MATPENGHLTMKATAEPPMEMPPDPASFELRVLQAKQMRVFRHAGVPRLTLENDRSWIKIAVARAFPLSDPDHYLGFLDGAGKDIGMLQDPALLDPASRQVIDEELDKRYFVPVIDAHSPRLQGVEPSKTGAALRNFEFKYFWFKK